MPKSWIISPANLFICAFYQTTTIDIDDYFYKVYFYSENPLHNLTI